MQNKPKYLYLQILKFKKLEKRYNSASAHIKNIFEQRVQKVAVDAGFSCPNRDGKKGRGGCTYCNNDTFKPFYTSSQKSVTEQINEGISFFAKKYKAIKFLAYFQAFTNTYAPLSELKKLYAEALKHPQVVGLVISTRPDCVDAEKLDYLQKLSEKYYIVIEYGLESTNDDSLLKINRLHTFEEAKNAIMMTAERKITTGAHLIIGLPGETKTDILEHAKKISDLPITMLKLHQLQIIKGTKMARQYSENPENFDLFTSERYIDLMVDFLELLNPKIMIERFTSESPKDMLIAPNWGGLKNFEIVHKIEKKLVERNTWQGKKLINN